MPLAIDARKHVGVWHQVELPVFSWAVIFSLCFTIVDRYRDFALLLEMKNSPFYVEDPLIRGALLFGIFAAVVAVYEYWRRMLWRESCVAHFGYTYTDVDVSQKDGECSCQSCEERQRLGISALSLVSSSRCVQLSSDKVRNIRAHRQYIRAAFKSLGPELKTQWGALAPTERAPLLKSAFPAISKYHRPDFLDVQKPLRSDNKKAKHTRVAYETPQINLEDLCRFDTALVLARDRAKYPLSRFVPFDLAQMDNNASNHHVPKALVGTCMVFGDESANRFGALAKFWKLRSDDLYVLNPISGIRLLENTAYILLGCERLRYGLLQNTGLSQGQLMVGSLEARPQGATNLYLVTYREDPPQVTTLERDASYKVPGQLNFHELLRLVQVKVTEAEDHLGQLHGGSRYLIAEAQTWANHLPDTAGNHAENSEETRLEAKREVSGLSEQKRSKVVKGIAASKETIKQAYFSIFFWRKTEASLERLAELCAGVALHDTAASLSAEAQKEFCLLQCHLLRIMERDQRLISEGFPMSPTMHKHFVTSKKLLLSEEEETLDQPLSLPTLSPRKTMNNDELCAFKSLQLLVQQNPLTHAGYRRTVDQVQCLLDNIGPVKDCISDWTKAKIIEMAAACKLYYNLDTLLPHCVMWKANWPNAVAAVDSLETSIDAFIPPIGNILLDDPSLMIKDLHTQYVSASRVEDRQARQKIISIEDQVAEKWRRIRLFYSAAIHLDEGMKDTIDKILQAWPSSNSPAWDVDHPSTQMPRPGGGGVVHNPPRTSGRIEYPAAIVNAKPRKRQKDPGAPQAADQPPAAQAPAEAAQFDVQPVPRVDLDRRSFETADTLYRITGPRQAGSLPWTDVLHFMHFLGFNHSAAEGSRVTFTPVKGVTWDRNVVLHKPHPNSHYEPYQIHNMRQHLESVLQLTKDSFMVTQ
ncbi:uncharacterized protein CLAFUR5_13472 [Fulvia fulva]|uniref:Uncharacterized protein n=1 Tax=Passalora fulva TaxID=5499 RepID=A0A9Q8UW16_PASFU|nr:uncharacterized protein CLAFUR5_13472 [Fulvia fulva]UJO24551.1 hypothetical protein CLAFUR5_13472 [Fulvia fulva]